MAIMIVIYMHMVWAYEWGINYEIAIVNTVLAFY